MHYRVKLWLYFPSNGYKNNIAESGPIQVENCDGIRRKYATPWQRRTAGNEIIDALIDLLILVIHKIGVRAENKVEKELLNDLRRVRGKANVLFKLAEAAIDEPDDIVIDVLYPVVGLETLKDLAPSVLSDAFVSNSGIGGRRTKRNINPVKDFVASVAA